MYVYPLDQLGKINVTPIIMPGNLDFDDDVMVGGLPALVQA